MINARQRALLNAIGIPLWVPKASITSKVKHGAPAEHTIWRSSNDEQVAASATTLSAVSKTALSEPVEPSVDQVNLNTHVIADVDTPEKMAFADAHVVVEVVENKAPQTVIDSIKHDVEPSQFVLSEKPLSSLPFRIQACEINQWVLLVNEEDLKNAQRAQLWQNIRNAFQKNTADPILIHQFAWPLAEGLRWQSATGAKSALAGFLFKMGLDKRIGLMSELTDEVCPDRIERLPHLQELIDEPLKKRMLWHALK